MKNAYAAKLKAKKKQIEHESTKEGFDFSLNLCAVALNNEFGFGAERAAVDTGNGEIARKAHRH